MIRGIYTSQSSLSSLMSQMNVITNNLSNMNTTGYKSQEVLTKSFPEMLLRNSSSDSEIKVNSGSYNLNPILGKLGVGVEINKISNRFEQGKIKQTNNQFDMAINGRGFFVVRTPHGIRYTRDGSFVLNKNGYLVDSVGNFVQGENGDIILKKDNFKVKNNGSIYFNSVYKSDDLSDFTQSSTNNYENNKLLDNLKVVRFYNESMLQKDVNNLYKESKESGEILKANYPETSILQGYIEASNVNPVAQMTNMIEIQNLFKANYNVIQSNDLILRKAVNELAKVY